MQRLQNDESDFSWGVAHKPLNLENIISMCGNLRGTCSNCFKILTLPENSSFLDIVIGHTQY